MSSPIRNVLLIGAGGNLGPSILTVLNGDFHFIVSILARPSPIPSSSPTSKSTASPTIKPEVELLQAFRGQDAIVSTIATANAAQQQAIIDAAINAGVKRFVPSGFGSDTLNDEAMAILPQYYSRAIISGFMGFNIKEHKATIISHGNDTLTTKLDTISLAVKNALLVRNKATNGYLYIDTFTVSQDRVFTTLEKATDEKWKVTQVDAEELT